MLLDSEKARSFFEKKTNCPIAFKLRVYDAVIRTKLTYGLESAQLNQSTMKKLDTLQLKAFRKMLGITTAFIDRTHTNEFVIKSVNEAIAAHKSRPL